MAPKANPNAESRLSESDGHQLAADMLTEIQEHWAARENAVPEENELGNLWRKTDCAILRRYLRTVKGKHCSDLERGFLAVLTDFLGCTLNGLVPDPDFYESDRAAREG